MKFASLVAPVLLAVAAYAQDNLTLNTPTSGPVVCQPLLISWVGGTPPYILTVHNGADLNGAAVATLGTALTGNSFTWTVNVAPGNVGLKMIDSTGAISQTSAFDILTGPDTSCVGENPETTETTAPAPTNTGAPTATGGAPTTTATRPTTTPATTGTGTATGSSPAASATESNGASANVANVGIAGLAAALFAIVA